MSKIHFRNLTLDHVEFVRLESRIESNAMPMARCLGVARPGQRFGYSDTIQIFGGRLCLKVTGPADNGKHTRTI